MHSPPAGGCLDAAPRWTGSAADRPYPFVGAACLFGSGVSRRNLNSENKSHAAKGVPARLPNWTGQTFPPTRKQIAGMADAQGAMPKGVGRCRLLVEPASTLGF